MGFTFGMIPIRYRNFGNKKKHVIFTLSVHDCLSKSSQQYFMLFGKKLTKEKAYIKFKMDISVPPRQNLVPELCCNVKSHYARAPVRGIAAEAPIWHETK
jgi:hypothetical protein